MFILLRFVENFEFESCHYSFLSTTLPKDAEGYVFTPVSQAIGGRLLTGGWWDGGVPSEALTGDRAGVPSEALTGDRAVLPSEALTGDRAGVPSEALTGWGWGRGDPKRGSHTGDWGHVVPYSNPQPLPPQTVGLNEFNVAVTTPLAVTQEDCLV